MISVRNLSFCYGSNRALEKVSLEIQPGQVTAVLGLSGSGKTTLLNLLGALSNAVPDSGEITYRRDATCDGTPYVRLSSDALAQLRREEFGFILQSAYMLSHFTCGQNIGMPLRLQGWEHERIEARVSEILLRADPSGKLQGKQQAAARDTSGGERQRMAVLRAIIHDPGVLFADEPLSSLDPHNAEIIVGLLRDWLAGKLNPDSKRHDRALVLVTHDIDVAWREGDVFAILNNGALQEGRLFNKEELGGPDEIRRRMKLDVEPAAPSEAAAPEESPVPNDNGTQPSTKDRKVSPPAAVVQAPGRLGFLRWFARLNLWETQARRSTGVNIVSIALVVGFVIFTFGITWGIDQARRRKLQEDPLALCCWIGSSVERLPIDDSFRSRVEQAVARELGADDAIEVFPFRERLLHIYDKSGQRVLRPQGRTVMAEDKLFDSVPLRGNTHWPTVAPATPGLIVTPGLLSDLGYGPDEHPRELSVEPVGGGKISVPVIDETTGKLPLNYSFALSEPYDRDLRQRHGNLVLESIRIGPVPPDWPSVEQLPDELTEMFRTYKLYPPAAEGEPGKLHWVLQHNGNGDVPALEDWHLYVERIHEAIVGLDRPGGGKYSARPELSRIQPPDAPPDPNPPPLPPYDYAAVYFQTVEQLERAIPVFEQAHAPLNQETVRQLKAISEQTQAVITVLSALAVIIAGVVLLNMALIQVLRSEQKTGEVGMLKAMGMTTPSLRWLAVVESMQLWGYGSLAGIAGAIILGLLVASLGSHVGAGFAFSLPLIGVTSLLALVACLAANVLAIWRALRAPPSQSLRVG